MNVSAGSGRDLRPCIWPAGLVIVLVAKADVGAGGLDFSWQPDGGACDDLRAPPLSPRAPISRICWCPRRGQSSTSEPPHGHGAPA